MGKNSSPWTKFDPLTTNIFWIYFSSLDIYNKICYSSQILTPMYIYEMQQKFQFYKILKIFAKYG